MVRMSWLSVAVALGLFASTAVDAGGPAVPLPTGYGAAVESCGTWLANRHRGDWYTDGQWVLGWVSAAGVYQAATLRPTDANAMAVWVDNYCTAHPLDQLWVATAALVQELSKPAS